MKELLQKLGENWWIPNVGTKRQQNPKIWIFKNNWILIGNNLPLTGTNQGHIESIESSFKEDEILQWCIFMRVTYFQNMTYIPCVLLRSFVHCDDKRNEFNVGEDYVVVDISV